MTIHETTEQINTLKADLTGYINVTVQEYEAMKGNGLLVKVKEVEELLQEELQKARKQWLRDEIVELRKMMKDGYGNGREDIRQEGYNKALSDIIDRYQAELNEKVI